jgi:hypothetical protein
MNLPKAARDRKSPDDEFGQSENREKLERIGCNHDPIE